MRRSDDEMQGLLAELRRELRRPRTMGQLTDHFGVSRETLFRWFEESCGLDEAAFRSSIYMAAVCRCFPGKKEKGGD
ncbi:hypothetical protein LCGC14_1717020, partial [marine sediment metagenome]